MADETKIDPFIIETKILGGMSEEDRTRYVISIIDWLSSRAKWVLNAKGKVQMMKRFESMSAQASGRGEEMLVCVLWTIKPEFRKAWMELLGTLVEMDSNSIKPP